MLALTHTTFGLCDGRACCSAEPLLFSATCLVGELVGAGNGSQTGDDVLIDVKRQNSSELRLLHIFLLRSDSTDSRVIYNTRENNCQSTDVFAL